MYVFISHLLFHDCLNGLLALNGYGAADIWPNLVGLAAFALLPLVVGWHLKRTLLTVKYIP